MCVYVYHSELTHRTIISINDHGKTWEMPDGEVYDQYPIAGTFGESGIGVRCIVVDNGEVSFTFEENLG